MLPIEVGIVHRIFGEARSETGEPLYEVVTCAPVPGEVRTDADFTVNVAHGPEALEEADTVVVPASAADYADGGGGRGVVPGEGCADVPGAARGAAARAVGGAGAPGASAAVAAVVGAGQERSGAADGDPGTDPAAVVPREATGRSAEAERAAMTRALRRVRAGTRVASICTGSFVLAAAGLLDGRRATTHWKSADDFRRLFPEVALEPDVLYTEDRGVLTAAGVASGIDLCLHMVRCDHGAAVAGEVARRTVVPPYREGGQAQYIRRPVPAPRVSSTAAARTWALDHLDRPVTLRELAECEAMSVRTFTRRFREEMGVSPHHWLTRQRVERARELLEETDLTVERIAARAGFGTAASLRAHVQAVLGVSPREYRRTFRGV
ncbi:GlxA family transcriptional regulator [Streptomyces catenulae]|uniref:Helix-turn-helix domain-containing protein n=1 Tax=Streptomyces catenulae TaxID=66875 RepID=A0ABV2Z1M5_9ACTN|nr:helix-turn-helix domain-containing protein [Streptomyces catenulae]